MKLNARQSRVAMALVAAVALMVIYVIAALIGPELDKIQENERVLLPQSGVALAGLIILGLWFWPAIMIASFSISVYFERPIQTGIALALGNTIAPLVGAWLIRRKGRYQPGMLRMRDVYAFLFYGCLLAPAINAIYAVLGILLQLGHDVAGPFLRPILWKRWFGHAVSNLIVAPVFLTWSRRPELKYPSVRIVETVLLLGSLAWVLVTVFTEKSAIAGLNYPVSFLPFPVMIWAALRYGPRGGATATFILAAVAVYGTSRGYGPFVREERGEGLVLLQVYLLCIALSALFLGSAMAERREAQRSLEVREEELTALSARLQHAREEERTTISREIHDELGQQLTGIKMGIHALSRKVDALPELQKPMERLMQQTDDAVSTVRNIATNLRPGILDDLGIVAALQWMVDDFEARTGLEAIIRSNVEDLKVNAEQKITLFRVAQEALTNVARHANAFTVQVDLTKEDSRITLSVTDDGNGIAEGALGGASLGVVGMRERVALLGGVFEIGPAGESGTRVLASIPTGEIK